MATAPAAAGGAAAAPAAAPPGGGPSSEGEGLAPVADVRIDRETFRRTVRVPALRVTARQCNEVVRMLRG